MSKINFKEVDVFHFEEGMVNFNSIARESDFTYWYASEYMYMLGYEKMDTFRKAINKAMTTCMTLDIETVDNFRQVKREVDGEQLNDYELSRFACYLVAMNADNRKPEVAGAQAFFAATAETIRRYVDSAEDVERVLIRDEISTHEKSLSGVAKDSGVDKYHFFQNAGYRGLYNMNLSDLKTYKGLQQEKRTLLDFMGKDELAANLFRITQTELKMKAENIKGQRRAEVAAESVGKTVRKAMLDISGVRPEDLKLTEDIKKVKTSLKHTHKGLKKLDN